MALKLRNLIIKNILMIYPRTIVLKDKYLAKLLREKAAFVEQGRAESELVEQRETEMAGIDKQIQDVEQTVDIKDLNDKAQAITEEFNAVVKRMEAVKQEIYDRLKSQVPTVLGDKYAEVKKQKDGHENARNRYGLKVQKWKDKIIPYIQKLVRPQFQNEFEDIEGFELSGEDVVVRIYNHREEWEQAFRKKQ